MIVLSVMLLLFFIFFLIYANQITISHESADRITTERIASGIRAAINYVYLAGDGAEYNASFAYGLSDVNVSVYGGTVDAQSDVAQYSLPLLTQNVNETYVSPGNVMIRNDGGMIEISQPQ